MYTHTCVCVCDSDCLHVWQKRPWPTFMPRFSNTFRSSEASSCVHGLSSAHHPEGDGSCALSSPSAQRLERRCCFCLQRSRLSAASRSGNSSLATRKTFVAVDVFRLQCLLSFIGNLRHHRAFVYVM